MRLLRTPSFRVLLASGAVLAVGTLAAAADPPKPTTVVKNIENPSGVAIQPSSGHVFVAGRAGVFRYVPATKKVNVEIGAYPTDIYGKGPMYDIGPLGLAFLDAVQVVVGDGSRKDGEELVRIYKVGAEPGKPQKESAASATLGPIAPGDDSPKGEGNFYGVAVGAGAVWVTCNGDDTKGWVAKAPLENGKPGALKPTIPTKEKTMVDAPVPVTFTPDGATLVIGQMGEMNVPGDSLFTTYDPATGNLKQSLKTGLHDIAGVAYSPKTGSLYVTDFAWSKPEDGGLYKLTITGDEVKAEKIVALDKPAGLAFDKDGRLFIAVFGTVKEGDKNPAGSVVSIEPGL